MAWRRPTLPCLKTQYHGRWGFSRPSSGWDRVQAPRHGHQAVQSTLFVMTGCIEVLVVVVCGRFISVVHPGTAGFVCLPGDLGMISMHDVRFIEPVGRLGPVS